MKALSISLAVIVCVLALSVDVIGQSKFNKQSRNLYKSKYRAHIVNPAKKCTSLKKKKNNGPELITNYNLGKKPKVKKMAEVDYTLTASAKPVPTPAPRPAPVPVAKPAPKPAPTKPETTFENKSIEEKHTIEDEVFAKNNIPVPTSSKHAEIRQKIENQLKTIEDNSPIELEPLYFNFDEDEFSVVDMDPFLVAVEYAMQGRMILISGHTDSKGADNYNVQLSIKRVEKIRSLMHEIGVPDDRISVVGYGEEKAKEGDEASSRRVDFTVF